MAQLGLATVQVRDGKAGFPLRKQEKGRYACEIGTIYPFSVFGISGGFGVLEPQIHHLSFSGPKQAPKTLRFKGKMAKFEAKKL